MQMLYKMAKGEMFDGTPLGRPLNENGEPVEQKKSLPDPYKLVTKLRMQLARGQFYGLPGVGDKMSEIITRFKNEHVIFSVCLCHQLHPFTGFKRIIWFWNHCCWLFMWSAILGLCIPGSNGGIVFARSMITMLISLPFDIGLRYAMECTCLLGNSFAESIGKQSGNTVVLTFTMSSIGWLVTGISLASLQDPAFVPSWIISQVLAVFSDAMKHILMQFFFVKKQKEYFINKYSPFFPEGDPPKNLSEVAVLSRQIYGLRNLPDGMTELEWMEIFKVTSTTRKFSIPKEEMVGEQDYANLQQPGDIAGLAVHGKAMNIVQQVMGNMFSGGAQQHGYRQQEDQHPESVYEHKAPPPTDGMNQVEQSYSGAIVIEAGGSSHPDPSNGIVESGLRSHDEFN
mmetsp:Transcript_10884/g.17434  ORF Transcript_10884/g.17434 Transcript_10884/m.17434 type:complete len:398 (+) Transcript_10884:48-1241(+)